MSPELETTPTALPALRWVGIVHGSAFCHDPDRRELRIEERELVELRSVHKTPIESDAACGALLTWRPPSRQKYRCLAFR